MSNPSSGDLAALVVHDLTDSLRRIRLHTELLQEALEESGEQADREPTMLIAALGREVEMARELAEAVCRVMVGEDVVMDGNDMQRFVDETTDLPDGFTLRWSGDIPPVKAPLMLAQTIGNLVRNAIKHHDSTTGTIQVVHDAPWFHVVDDGPGYGSDGLVRPGLGLQLVKRLIHQAGGRIKMMPVLPRGTKVSFSWPTDDDCREPRIDVRSSTRTPHATHDGT